MKKILTRQSDEKRPAGYQDNSSESFSSLIPHPSSLLKSLIPHPLSLLKSLIPHPSSFQRHAVNASFLALVIIALFWRVLFLGETFVDVATLNNQLPWGYYAGESIDYNYNRRDLTDTYITRDYFVVQAYRDGEMPLWNPYTMAGHPIYADGVTRTLSPFLLFYKFFDVPLGYSLARIFELMLAAIFMYIFLIGVGASEPASLLGALVFVLSSHSLLHVTGLGWWGGLMWLPLILLFVDRAARQQSYTQAIIAGVFLALQFYCGWMQNQIYYVGAIALYYLFFAFEFKNWRSKKNLNALGMLAVTLVVGFLLAAPAWIPVMQLLRFSNRRIVPTELGYIYLPPWYLFTLVFPNLFGTADDAEIVRIFTALGVSHDHILYMGIAALAPLGFGLFWLKQNRRLSASQRPRVVFFALLAALALVIMIAAPIYVHMTRFIPVLQVIRVIVRAWVLFIFAAAVLAAFGIDLLLSAKPDLLASFARIARKFLWGAIAFVILGVIASYLLELTGFALDNEQSGKIAFLRRSAAALAAQFTPPDAALIIPLALIVGVVILLSKFASSQLSSRAFFALLMLMLLVDLFWNSAQFNPTFDRSRVFPETKITELLHRLPPGRVLIVPSDLDTNRRASDLPDREKIIAPPNTLLPYRISTVTGKNQQFPKWYRQYAALIEKQPYLSHVVFDQARSRYFDLLNVRYVLTHSSLPPLEGYDLIASEEGIAVYENKQALPRAFFAEQAETVPNHSYAISAMNDPGFDPHTTAVIEAPDNSQSETPDFKSQISNLKSGGEARITEDARNRVVISTESEQGGLLVLSDNYYPGWRATIDGEPADILQANITMRAVRVPPGGHVVSFQFAPAAFWSSVYASLAGAGVVFAFLIIAFVRRQRRAARQE